MIAKDNMLGDRVVRAKPRTLEARTFLVLVEPMGYYLRLYMGLSHLNALQGFCPIYLRIKVQVHPTH